MHDRVTLVSIFDNINMEKIEYYTKQINENLCKVPFGKNVANRIKVDTLPYHSTLSAWNIEDEENIINVLSQIEFPKLKIYINNVEIMQGKENSYVLYFNIKENEKLKILQKQIYQILPKGKYNLENFKYHITIHIDKVYNKIIAIQEKILQDVKPFELEVSTFRLYEIYPAKLVKQFNSITDKDYFTKIDLTTIDKFFVYMQNEFHYGWLDQTGNKHYGVNDAKTYSLQTPMELLKNHLGICWDMTELCRYWFNLMTHLKIETYYIFYDDNNGCPSHSILVFYNYDKVYWFEPMFTDDNCYYSGIHKYNNISELLKDIKSIFIKYSLYNKAIQSNYDINKFYLYKYTKPKYHINGHEMRQHIDNSTFINIDSL